MTNNHSQLFSNQAAIYKRIRPRYPSAIYEYLARQCASNELAWDCGCGNGQVTLDLIKFFNQVEATDISEQQIACAPIVRGAKFTQAAAENTKFDNHCFDLICVAQALHWFDLDKFWPEVDRVLRSGGVLTAWGYQFPNLDNILEGYLQTHLYDVIKPFWSERNQLLWNCYADINFPYQPLKTPDLFLRVNWNLEEFCSYLRSWSAVNRCIETIGEDFFQSVCSGLALLWGDKTKRRAITMDVCFIATQKVSVNRF